MSKVKAPNPNEAQMANGKIEISSLSHLTFL